MRKSKNGQWIIDDERYQWVTIDDNFCISRVLRYSFGFNSVTVVYEKYDNSGIKCGEVESTWPRHIFKKVVRATYVDTMIDIIKQYGTKRRYSQDLNQRLYEYRNYILKYYPEKLI